MTEVIVGRGDRPPLEIRINGDAPTFTIESDRIAAAMNEHLTPVHEDLLEIASAVFAADGAVPRGGETRPRMGENWRRVFDFTIPVREPDFWSRPEVTEALVEAISFLTEDLVSFRFIPRETAPPRQPFLAFDPEAAAFRADEVILFSGGLDSFAGALEALATREGRIALVTHRSAQKAIPRQVRLGRKLAERFPGRVLHIQVKARRKGEEASDQTQRSRTFLFAALGQVVGQMLGAQRMSFYENGVVSHNLPISAQLVGTLATRTTHPKSLTLVNDLMGLIGPSPRPVVNAYEWLTKADVLARIAEYDGEDAIADTVSCTSVREQDTLNTHCGACSQCLDRRFAVLSAGLEDHDPEEQYRTDVLFGDREKDRSRTMALDWTRHALRLRDLDEIGFVKAFGREVVRVVQGHPDVSQAEALRRIVDLHHRHADAVIGVLVDALARSARDLATGRLPARSLLVMHAGQGAASETILEDPRAQAPPPRPERRLESDEGDLVPDPDRPLEVSFSVEGDRHIVDVRGLATVSGRPAEVAHVLKEPFDEDRRLGRTRDQHCYRMVGRLAVEMGVVKDTVAKYVQRCRETLADAHRQVHGAEPSRDLLIETRPQHGYRLDPDIRLVRTACESGEEAGHDAPGSGRVS